jgi:hypothetical protein
MIMRLKKKKPKRGEKKEEVRERCYFGKSSSYSGGRTE